MDFNRNKIKQMPVFFDRYINLVHDITIITALQESQEISLIIPKSILVDLGDKTYAPEKWTLKGIIKHLLHLQGILAHRALMFASNNLTPQPNYNEKSHA